MFTFLAATQDIAVDGWGLEILSKYLFIIHYHTRLSKIKFSMNNNKKIYQYFKLKRISYAFVYIIL